MFLPLDPNVRNFPTIENNKKTPQHAQDVADHWDREYS
jgi:hypothetical protein